MCPKSILQSEKFRRASKVTTKLASLASEVPGKGYKSRITLLESIVSTWEANEEVTLNGKFVIVLCSKNNTTHIFNCRGLSD